MYTFGIVSALALIVLGVAIAIDPSLRLWLFTPRKLKLKLVNKMLTVGVPTQLLVSAVNAAGLANVAGQPVALKAVPVVICADPSVTLESSADGLTVTVTASVAGTFEFDGTSPEPTGVVTGSVSGTFADAAPDLVPAKLVLTFVDA